MIMVKNIGAILMILSLFFLFGCSEKNSPEKVEAKKAKLAKAYTTNVSGLTCVSYQSDIIFGDKVERLDVMPNGNIITDMDDGGGGYSAMQQLQDMAGIRREYIFVGALSERHAVYKLSTNNMYYPAAVLPDGTKFIIGKGSQELNNVNFKDNSLTSNNVYMCQ